jgi:PAS domain S-box-containing protein/putative nucleotidyltransferase with HDIG domain
MAKFAGRARSGDTTSRMGAFRELSAFQRRWPSLTARQTLLLAAGLLLAMFAIRMTSRSSATAVEILYVIPIAILALQFGLRGGLPSALFAFALVLAWDLPSANTLIGTAGYLSRGLAFMILGTLLGIVVDHRRRLEAELIKYFDASLDLLATADLSGHLTRVNPAWEHALGYSAETMRMRPFVDFVHPEDREATIAETAALVDGSRDTVGFRNRYRAADGSWHWLEWSAHASDEVIHAVARDITVQVQAEQHLADSARLLEEKVAERTEELEDARTEVLKRLAFAAEYRDDDTFQHTERVGAAAALIARQIRLSAGEVAIIREAAPLHDIGKLAIPDGILLKPGRLTQAERAEMQTHTVAGARILEGSSHPVLQRASTIAATHHERWDGSGYPRGLRGEEIPLAGRIVAVADVFDALTHERPYKEAWPVEEALEEIRRGAGSQFDLHVVEAFLASRRKRSVRSRGRAARPPRHAATVRQASGV